MRLDVFYLFHKNKSGTNFFESVAVLAARGIKPEVATPLVLVFGTYDAAIHVAFDMTFATPS